MLLQQIGSLPEAVLGDGRNGSPSTDPQVNGSALQIWVNPTALSGRYNAFRVEALAAPSSPSPSGVYAIRGLAGSASGKTITGTTQTYVAGLQGKLTSEGAIGNNGSGSVYACAVLAQVNAGAGTYGSETQVYALWVDNQRPTAGEGVFYMVNITNNGGAIDHVFHVYGNNNIAGQFFSLETMGSAIVAITGNASHQTKALLVTIDGVQWYLPLQSATS
jgi:hypothetical protein